MLCPTCGNQLADDAKFCPKCGTRIEPSQPQPEQPSLIPQQEELPPESNIARPAPAPQPAAQQPASQHPQPAQQQTYQPQPAPAQQQTYQPQQQAPAPKKGTSSASCRSSAR